ncbi:MAG: potassium transporter Kup [Hyphomicrobiales bacterium]|nr:potassium transporter Kup [Hyphomicrobiales bacterium]
MADNEPAVAQVLDAAKSGEQGAGAGPAHPAQNGHAHPFWPMVLGSLGVVYGDIGTSPLYALKSSLDHAKVTGVNPEEVIGIVSLLTWALIFTVTVKYVLFLMRADNRGEGGTLALMALAQNALGKRTKFVFLMGVAGAALFSGDAIITPAISVLSAVEGLKLPAVQQYFDFTPYVLAITIVILVTLFVFQSSGTAKVASFFGPIMVFFFGVIGLLGARHILDSPQILYAISPIPGLTFLFSNGWQGFTTLGLVFLAVTGAEALYADMGHFGRRPIQIAWVCFVLPSLLLNYYGQGAFILSNLDVVKSEDFSPFFQIAPNWAVIPLIILSTVATIIASQAVITGAYSIVRQAIQLGLLPRMVINHTSEVEGQIYVPRINRLLLIGVLLLVIVFKTSDSLANAYGIAVTGTMVVTTALAFIVVWKLWRWPLWAAIPFVGCFLAVDLAFLTANLVKVLEGGWVPLTLGAISMITMWTWVRGTHLLNAKTDRDSIPTRDLLRMLEKSKPTRVPGTAVFLTANPTVAPSALMHNLKHNKVLHDRIVLMNIVTEDTPRVSPEKRFETEKLSDDFTRVTLHFGFMESPRIPAAMALLRKAGYKFDIMTTSFFLGRRSLKESPSSGMPRWQDKLFIVLSKQSANATDFFSIPSDRVVELGAQVTI